MSQISINSASPWLTVCEAAKRAKRGRRAIYAALADESLVGNRPGPRGNWRIHVDQLDAWVAGAKADVQVHMPQRRSA